MLQSGMVFVCVCMYVCMFAYCAFVQLCTSLLSFHEGVEAHDMQHFKNVIQNLYLPFWVCMCLRYCVCVCVCV